MFVLEQQNSLNQIIVIKKHLFNGALEFCLTFQVIDKTTTKIRTYSYEIRSCRLIEKFVYLQVKKKGI